MATDPNTALGTAPASTEAPATNPNLYTFQIPNTETQIGIDLSTIPAETRMQLLQSATRAYVVNSVNQAHMRANKANAAFDAYDEAMKADPLQTAVAKPEGERTTADLLSVASAARQRLYDGDVRKQGDGSAKPKATKDPLVKLVTDAVLREVFEKNKATSGYKWTDAVKTVGGDGIAYLNSQIDTLVAGGRDRAELEKFRDARYITPAKLMLGQSSSKATSGEGIL